MIPVKGCKYIVSEPTIDPKYRPNNGCSVPVIHNGTTILHNKEGLEDDHNHFQFMFPDGYLWW